ncbi:MAG: RecQ family ATP-dependent DNA helicase [Bacteroidia bacterium]|nr:RecQ family ATP-dependent DNA helicase [Bacteroidia bacterium]
MKAREILERYWGHKAFRPLQEEIIESVLAGNDTLALLPTGGGKSVCFQVPALCLGGLCLVISPLVALMKDQVERLRKMGIQAEALYSGQHPNEIKAILGNAMHEQVQFLYVSPERLKSKLFQANLPDLPIRLIAIDEAHCISQWGYDFRPEYREIAELRPLFPKVPFLALTASATARVRKDMMEILKFTNGKEFLGSFHRENLAYVVRNTENKEAQLLHIVSNLKGSGLVYTRSRKGTVEVAQLLQKNGISASFYHAGLGLEERNKRQQDWIDGKVRIMACTNAFGMGIDKPDCRFVIHLEMPDSPEAYYQEAGRAGRDGKKSYCVLLNSPDDAVKLKNRLEQNFPPESALRNLYDSISSYFHIPLGGQSDRVFPFDPDEFSRSRKLDPAFVRIGLSILAQQGLIYLSDSFYEQSKIQFLADPGELYRYQVENADMDVLIKMLLRTYGGLFDRPISIREEYLAKRLKLEPAAFKARLRSLHEQQVLIYQEQMDGIRLQFLGKRQSSSYIRFDEQFYAFRKEVYKGKLDAMLAFVEEKEACRTNKLLAYFDEYRTENCGTCDTCLEMKKQLKRDVPEMRKQIREVLIQNPCRPADLVSMLSQFNRIELENYLRILVDEKSVVLDATEKLKWISET